MPDVGNAAAQRLWESYTQDGSQDTKNEIVLHYMYLVKRIVYRLLPTYEGYSNFDDLLSCGVLGLIDAINKFDIKREIQFEHYATMRIRGGDYRPYAQAGLGAFQSEEKNTSDHRGIQRAGKYAAARADGPGSGGTSGYGRA